MDSNNIFEGNLTSKTFINFIWPSILMMLVMALYYTIDSIFVSNLVGEEGLAAINIAYPIQGIMWGFGVMLSGGSSPLVSIEMGRGNKLIANEKFTFIAIFSAICGCVFTVLCLIFMDPLVVFLGATEVLTKDCDIFLSVFVWGCPLAFCGTLFEFYIRVDGKPTFTIALYVAGGIAHLGLDILLMGPLGMGLKGAAIANVSGLGATALMGLVYFIFFGTNLKFCRFHTDWKYIGHSLVNGLPQLVNESAAGIKVFFFNIVIIKLAGETGVAAASIVLSLHYLFMSVHIGYVAGVQPIIGYYYGAQAFDKINRVLRYTRNYMIGSSLLMAGLSFFAAPLIIMIYVRPGCELFEMSLTGLRLASLSVLLIGINTFVSGFFTCYGNGLISSVIALSDGLVLLVAGLLLLSHFFGLNGAWLSMAFADALSIVLSFLLMNKYKTRYNYRVLG